MARRCTYGLACIFAAGLVAGCAAPEKSSDVQGRISDGGSAADLGGVGGNGGGDLAGGGPTDLARTTCVDGGSCMTVNPGACMMGHVACSGPVASCVPDVTTQPCYDGPAATMGVGVCHAGTQTCVGSLGSCDGEVKPAAIENCFNDLDDDCDGVVNNGCPVSLALGTPHALTLEGGPGGGLGTVMCPAGSYVTHGFAYHDDNDVWVAGAGVGCSTPTLVRGASSYSITLAAATAPAPVIGANSTGQLFDFPCTTTSFVAGTWLEGRALGGAGNYVSGFGMECANGTLTLGADNKLAIALATVDNGYTYYTARYDVTAEFVDKCAANEVLVGFNVHTGSWMDSIQAVCAPLTVVYK